MSFEPASASDSQRQRLLQELEAAVTRLDLLESARLQSDDATVPQLAADAQGLIRDVLALLGALESASQTSGDDGFDDGEAATWVGLRLGPAEPSLLPDVCFVAGLELSRALRGLSAATERERVEAAIETALRKLYRALRAVTDASRHFANPSVLRGEPLSRRADSELKAALAVRQLYMRFRQGLRRAQSDERQDVLTALRYAAGALATLAASPHYTEIRVADRALLRQQRERLLDWAHAGKPTNAGVQLLEDIFTCAHLLRDISRRQELRAHDVVLMRELVADEARDRASWLASLGRLSGLDDTLDGLTAQLRASADQNPVIDIIVRLSSLLHGL